MPGISELCSGPAGPGEVQLYTKAAEHTLVVLNFMRDWEAASVPQLAKAVSELASIAGGFQQKGEFLVIGIATGPSIASIGTQFVMNVIEGRRHKTLEMRRKQGESLEPDLIFAFDLTFNNRLRSVVVTDRTHGLGWTLKPKGERLTVRRKRPVTDK